MSCARCAKGKRRCNGEIPCDRCIRLELADSCCRVEKKKRGRRPLVVAEAPNSLDLALSLLLSHGTSAFAARPRDFASSFGCDLGGDFVGVEMAPFRQQRPTFLTGEDVYDAFFPWFAQSRVACCQLTHPAFFGFDLSGKRLGDVVTDYRSTGEVQDIGMFTVLQVPEGKSCVKQFDCPYPRRVQFGPLDLLCHVRNMFFFDETGMVKLMFVSIRKIEVLMHPQLPQIAASRSVTVEEENWPHLDFEEFL